MQAKHGSQHRLFSSVAQGYINFEPLLRSVLCQPPTLALTTRRDSVSNSMYYVLLFCVPGKRHGALSCAAPLILDLAFNNRSQKSSSHGKHPIV